MFGVLPEWIATDPLLAAGGRLQGRVALDSLPRLAESLHFGQGENPDAEAEFELAADAQGFYRLKGKVTAQLCLCCVRCQDSLQWPVETSTDLYLVNSEAAAAALGDEAEYVVAVDNVLKVHDLIEDELILALPQVARHPPGTKCGDRAQTGPLAESGARVSPFAILKDLKK